MLGLRFKFRAVVLKTLLFVSTGLIVIGFAPSGVSGATGDEFSIIASVQNQTLVDGSTSRTPVEGVTINVLKVDGTSIGEAVTDKDGLCTISVPSRDDYVIELNLSTLPDGLTLIDAEKQKVAVNRELFTTNTKKTSISASFALSSDAVRSNPSQLRTNAKGVLVGAGIQPSGAAASGTSSYFVTSFSDSVDVFNGRYTYNITYVSPGEEGPP